MYNKTKFIYVGLDLHKEQHTAVIMDCFNEKLGEVTFQNKPSEFSKLLVKTKRYCTDGKGIVFALENSYGYGRALATWLIERNYIVKEVNSALSYAYRKSVPQYKNRHFWCREYYVDTVGKKRTENRGVYQKSIKRRFRIRSDVTQRVYRPVYG